MEANDTSYMDFLRIYFKSTADTIDALKATAPKGDTPEELKKSTAEIEEKIKAVVNKEECVRDYQAYQKLPDGIKARFNGTKVPDDIMEAARRDEVLTLIEMDTHPEIQHIEDARDAVREKYGLSNIPADIYSETAIAVFAVAVAAGYSEYAGQHLAQQRQHREGLLDKKANILANDNLSDKEKEQMLKDWFKDWIATREETVKTITDDWRGNPAEHKPAHQPEKYLIHLLAQYNRLGKKGPSAQNDDRKQDLLQQIADYALMVETQGRQGELLEYLKKRNIQAKIGHFSNETRDILANSVLHNVPDAEKEQYLARDWRRQHGQSENAPLDKQAKVIATDISNARQNALPEQNTLSSQERMANMPSMLNRHRGVERQT